VTIASLNLIQGRRETLAGARSSAYGLLREALAFPDEDFMTSLRSGCWTDGLASIAAELPFAIETGLLPAGGDLPGAYVNLFEVGVGRPFCPLYEGSHRNGRLKLMEDLVRFYEHFGLKTAPGDHPDHLCAELEFMHYLAFKEAAAESQGQDGAGLRLAQFDFLDRHLCLWLPRVVSRLDEAADVPRFYGWVLRWADDFCRADRRWLKEARVGESLTAK
jgi:DMSO reductase family type II enzyme chaperone